MWSSPQPRKPHTAQPSLLSLPHGPARPSSPRGPKPPAGAAREPASPRVQAARARQSRHGQQASRPVGGRWPWPPARRPGRNPNARLRVTAIRKRRMPWRILEVGAPSPLAVSPLPDDCWRPCSCLCSCAAVYLVRLFCSLVSLAFSPGILGPLPPLPLVFAEPVPPGLCPRPLHSTPSPLAPPRTPPCSSQSLLGHALGPAARWADSRARSRAERRRAGWRTRGRPASWSTPNTAPGPPASPQLRPHPLLPAAARCPWPERWEIAAGQLAA